MPARSAISTAPLSVVYSAVYVLQPLDPVSVASSPNVAVSSVPAIGLGERVAGQEAGHLPAPHGRRSFVAEELGFVGVEQHDLVVLVRQAATRSSAAR